MFGRGNFTKESFSRTPDPFSLIASTINFHSRKKIETVLSLGGWPARRVKLPPTFFFVLACQGDFTTNGINFGRLAVKFIAGGSSPSAVWLGGPFVFIAGGISLSVAWLLELALKFDIVVAGAPSSSLGTIVAMSKCLLSHLSFPPLLQKLARLGAPLHDWSKMLSQLTTILSSLLARVYLRLFALALKTEALETINLFSLLAHQKFNLRKPLFCFPY